MQEALVAGIKTPLGTLCWGLTITGAGENNGKSLPEAKTSEVGEMEAFPDVWWDELA